MAPKAGMTQTQKLERMLQYFHESATCHTLKDLERSIPTATKVNKMQVKDLLQELTDTDQVKVKKIGSGNWYWAWADDEVNNKKNALAKLEEEKDFLSKSNIELQSRLNAIKSEQSLLQDNPASQDLIARLDTLEHEVKALETEKDRWENAVTGGLDEKLEEVEHLRAEATDITNNIYVLEDSLRKLAGLDKHGMQQLRMKCYGDSYVEGEELPGVEEI